MHAMALIFNMMYEVVLFAVRDGDDGELDRITEELRRTAWFFISAAMDSPIYREAAEYAEGWGVQEVNCPHAREKSCVVCSTWNGEEETGGSTVPTAWQRRQDEDNAYFEVMAGSPVVRITELRSDDVPF